MTTRLPKLAAPAARAMDAAGITGLEKLSRFTRAEVASMHGIGKNALAALEAALHQSGMAFRNPPSKKVDTYIAAFDGEVRKRLESIRNLIRAAAPEAAETIAYGMPTYHYRENLFHFAGYRNHVGFYPTPSAMERFAGDLKMYRTSTGAVQFPLHAPLPEDLIQRMVMFRLDEVKRKTG